MDFVDFIFLETKCIFCGNVKTLKVGLQDYLDYINDTPVQDAFPYLSADDRELLISKVCGNCFDEVVDAWEPEV